MAQEHLLSFPNLAWAFFGAATGVWIGLEMEAWFAGAEGAAYVQNLAVERGYLEPITAIPGVEEKTLSSLDASILGTPTLEAF